MSSSGCRITPVLGPNAALQARLELTRSQRLIFRRRVLIAAYNWALWCFIVTIVLFQFLGIVSDSTKATLIFKHGESPLLGPFAIAGENDEPYSDRMIMCKLRGRLYKPAQLSAILEDPTTALIDSNGSAINGYRVVKRNAITLESVIYDWYSNTCSELAANLDSILDSCTALGYNVTRDNLRIADDLHSTKTFLISNALPILVMPYWDNAYYSHYMIPGWNGSACAFRLTGKYESQEYSSATMFGPDRSVRESKTVEWLQRPGGVWKNSWYEDLTGTAWYSDMVTADSQAPFGIKNREFDIIINQELSHTFINLPYTWTWGDKLSVSDTEHNLVSIVISNGLRYGLFLYENSPVRVVKCAYDLETFISNTSAALLLFRWMVVMATLQSSYWRRRCRHLVSAGIGCLSSSRTFLLLPIVLVPRLKQSLTAFFTVGCVFEGDQMPFSEAWFVIYPGVVELVLLYFSLLTQIARLLRRRMTDVYFGLTLVFFCAMHYLRIDIAQSGWFEIDGRVGQVVSAKEFEELKLFDFFSSDVALRVNGNIRSLFMIKLVVLGLNLLPLLVSASTSASSSSAKRHPPCQIEKILAIRACCSGGLGRSALYYESTAPPYTKTDDAYTSALSEYELLRLGYVVLGDKFLISILEWVYFSCFATISRGIQPSSYRVLIFEIQGGRDGRYEIVGSGPSYFRVNDPRLRDVRFWQLSAVASK